MACGLRGAAARPRVAPSAGAAAGPGEVLTWTDSGLWVAGVGAGAHRLCACDTSATAAAADPTSPTRRVGALPAPVPVAGGLWACTSAHELRSWKRSGEGAWEQTGEWRLDEPVRALGASADGGFVLVAHGEQLSLLGADGALLRRYEGTDLARRARGRAEAIVYHRVRHSFIVSWPDLGELWEIALEPGAPSIYDGLVHDYRMGEALATPGMLGVRRAPLGAPTLALEFADARVPWVAGRLADRVQVVNLDVRRPLAEWSLPQARPDFGLLAHTATESTWRLPCADGLCVIDARRWRVTGRERWPDVMAAATDSGEAGPWPLHALQAVGDALWLLAGHADGTSVHARTGGAWRAYDLERGRPCAMGADAAGVRLLLATVAPAGMLLLDADGRVRHEWALPADLRPLGVRWLVPG